MPKINKMIQLTPSHYAYVDKAFKRNFSAWIERQLNAHSAGLQHATEMASKQLIAIVLARQQIVHGYDHELVNKLVELTQDTDLQ